MADSITKEERHNCWLAMAAVFVDNEVDYEAVAKALIRHCPNMTDLELKRTFFCEVTPVLGSNGLTPAPSVWIAFDGNAVLRDITGWLDRQRVSAYYRTTGYCWCAICRYIFKDMWMTLARELSAQRLD